MEKIWYLIVEGATLGPHTVDELLREPGFNPNSLVWRPGFADWTVAKEVPELAPLFEKKNEDLAEWEEDEEETGSLAEGEAILAVKKEPPFFLIWLIIAGLIFLYLAIQFYA